LTTFFSLSLSPSSSLDGKGIGKNHQGSTRCLDQKYKATKDGIGKEVDLRLCFVVEINFHVCCVSFDRIG
jgi:hypothetical protein